MEDLLKRRFFVRPSFEIYEGVSGLYDYGPPGCSVKRALETAWRRHFVHEEDMLEVECTNLTPEACLKASGHADRFTDFLVKEVGTGPEEGKSYRADKLIEDFFQAKLADPKVASEEKRKIREINPASMSAEQLHKLICEYAITAPGTAKPLSFPQPFNLMFETSIGPTRKLKAFLRPETAQGIFVNFRNLYEQNGCKLPFAAAQIGTGFRNEISPRDGLLRVREFTMAEIEHFVNPKEKTHSKFSAVKDMKLPLWSKTDQAKNSDPQWISLDSAVSSGLVSNQTIGYYLARTSLFLQTCGISPDCIRFRQHLDTEMAHYAKDCWDAEIFTSYGWVECVGIADRHCYDLKQHALASKKNLYAAERLSGEKKAEEVTVLKANKGKIGTVFKGLTQEILKIVEEMTEEQKAVAVKDLTETGKMQLKLSSQDVILTSEMVSPLKVAFPVTQTLFHPSVIEPSFGISRILYAVFEHVFNRRAEPGRNFLHFPVHLAPIHCSLLPLSNHPQFTPLITQLRRQLLDYELATETDSSSVSIGRRYARTDEVGIPFACTIDFQSLQDHTVTLRELSTMRQVRMPLSLVSQEIAELAKGRQSWQGLERLYPAFTRADT